MEISKDDVHGYAQEEESFKLAFNMRLLSLLILKYPLRHFYEDWILHVDGFIHKNISSDGKKGKKNEIKKIV